MNGGDTPIARNPLQRQIEIRRIDPDQHIRWIANEPPPDLAPDSQESREMANHLKQAHYGELLAIEPGPATLCLHRGPGNAFKFDSGVYAPGGPNQARTELIAGSLSCNDNDPGHGLPVSDLADNAALGTAKKIYQDAELGLLRKLRGELLQRLCGTQARAVQKPISFLEVFYLTL